MCRGLNPGLLHLCGLTHGIVTGPPTSVVQAQPRVEHPPPRGSQETMLPASLSQVLQLQQAWVRFCFSFIL